MEIRNVEIKDLEQIAKILKQVAQIHYMNRTDLFKNKNEKIIKEEIKETMNNHSKKILIISDKKSIVYGTLIYSIKEIKNHNNLKDMKILWIEDLGVDERFRNKGIGKKLILEAEKIAKKLKCERIELNCWEFNQNAIKFYNKVGMETQRRIIVKEIGGNDDEIF